MFSDFKFLLNRAVRRSGASGFVDEKTVLRYFSNFLREVFGKNADDKFKIIDFSDGVINVASLCELNAVNLRNKEQSLVDKLNEKLDKKLVKEIRVLT
ncbi:MAG: hypothetical protein PF572_05070 [Patescibacteria group bacterium]|jgi:hypothetical protein|nr:hypothetical protein [Patescibacteria group bacterium]